MINIQLEGQIAQKRRVTTYIRSILTFLMPELRRDVDVTVTTVSQCEGGALGLCYGARDSVEIELSRTLMGDKIPLEEMMQTLAHELVHAKQFIKGELSPKMTRFKTIYHAHTPYSKQPLEHEAYRKEVKLYKIFWE